MIIAQHLRPAAARFAVSMQEHRRVDLEVAQGICGAVGRGHESVYRAIRGAEQEAAALFGMCQPCLLAQ